MSRTYKDRYYKSSYERSVKFKIKRHERAMERDFCDRSVLDLDHADSKSIDNRARTWGHGWYPYWAPMNRWLNSHIGQPWNLVYSELLNKLKSNSYKNDKELRKVILDRVEVYPNPKFSYRYNNDGMSYSEWNFYVDDNGLLQKRKHVARTRYPNVKCDQTKIAEWLDGRIVGKRGDKFYWFVHCFKGKKLGRYGAASTWKCEWNYNNCRYGLHYKFLANKPIYKDGEIVGHEQVWEVPFHFKSSYEVNVRQDREFSDKDLEMWNTIPNTYQDSILRWSPLNPKPDLTNQLW